MADANLASVTRSTARAIAATLFVLAAACNGILGNEPSITYLEGGDAQVPGSNDEGGADAASDSDAAANDATTIPDGSVDFFDGAVAACDWDGISTDKFCADFDPPNDSQPFRFSAAYPAASGAFLLDDASVTPPSALLVKGIVGDAPRFLRRRFNTGGQLVAFSFSLFGRQLANADFLVVNCRKNGDVRAIAVGWTPSGLSLRFEGQTLPLGTLAAGSWQRVSVVVDAKEIAVSIAPAAGGPSASYRLNGSCSAPYDVDLGLPAIRAIDAGSTSLLFDQVRGRQQ
jgi:hypothetical protein